MWRPARLVDVYRQTDSARTLRFAVPGWPGHLAGQHVDVRLAAEDGYTAQRTYSLSAPSDGESVEITVQRVTDGEVSPFLVDEIEVGDAVDILGPVGGWFVWRPTQTSPTLLVAGGSGIAPLMAMIRAGRATGSGSGFRLIYSVRSPGDVYFADETLEGKCPDSLIHVLYTRSSPAGPSRPPRRITADDLADHGWPPEAGPTCYVCGPTPFVEAVTGLRVAAGHRPDRIRAERFGPTGA
jgi:ferredoxin-NADP reductase